MTHEEFNKFCGSFTAATHVVQWGGSHVWKIGGKVFAIGGWEKECRNPAFTFKTSEQNFHFLCEHPDYRPAPYLASRGMKWIQQFKSSDKERDELKYYISESYRVVSLGLTKKKQKELGLNQDKL
jgi:predicted DNA-binding protein (MmcQ/YjbR family)